ncbi:GNAT family N-acetyltransferase [Micromonospora sp. SH-82]|uniref:GNAT family N-acetyltransferase n=1 Tax=Micromonospora sp. SH-82 TaxID=3132938 RepID=UPI003EBB54B6
MNGVEIVEDGLRLRPWQASDADAVHRACQDPDIRRWTRVPSPYRRRDAVGFLTDLAPAAWADGTGAPFAVCDEVGEELLGSCSLVSIDRVLRSGEVGYWTAPWARGRGVAERAVRALARWAFATLDLRRLLWQAELGNHASRLVALRAGFRIEGQLRLADPVTEGGDGWIGSLLPGEVPAPGAPGPAATGTLAARRAAVFGRDQPTLFATVGDHELRLRPLEVRDLGAVTTTCQDPETIRWTTVPVPYRHDDAEAYLGVTRRAWAAGTAANFVLADQDDCYVGVIDLRLSPTDPLLADVGFMVAPHARGRGYVAAGLAALSTWGFTTLGLARIEWRAMVGNTASRRAAEKAGFTVEGTLRAGLNHRGQRVDCWIAALLPQDVT